MGDLRILILLVLSFCILNSVYADVFTVSPDVAVVVDDPVIKDAVRTQITLVDAGMTSDEIPVAVTVSSLVDDATGLVLLPLNGDEHVFMLEKGSSFPFYFRYSLTDDVKDKGGHFEGKVSFTYNSSTLDVSVTYDREPKKISSGIYAEQGSSSSILRVELDDIKIEGQSDGNDAAVGNGEDLHFGDEVDIELTLRHASGSSLDFLRIDYIDLVSNDLELDAEITSDDDDKLSSGERTRADILFTLPSLEELALEDIASEYLLQIVVGARDEDGERHEVILPVFLRVERESRSLEISSLSLSSDILYCGNSTLTVTGTVTNYGTKTERDVRLSIDMYSLNRSVHHVFNALSPLSKQEFSVDIPMVILPSATHSASLNSNIISCLLF